MQNLLYFLTTYIQKQTHFSLFLSFLCISVSFMIKENSKMYYYLTQKIKKNMQTSTTVSNTKIGDKHEYFLLLYVNS